MARITQAMTKVFDYTWARLLDRLAGLGDEEYFWEPVRGCWSLRQAGDGRWRLDGAPDPTSPPDPAPITTIAWRIAHIGMMFVTFGDRFFGDATLTDDDVELAGSASAAVPFLERCYQGYWRQGLDALAPQRWWGPIGRRFGMFARDSGTDLALHVLDEFVHHSAEVGLMRDLYLRRGELTRG
jgi:hypothetical protein